jgi:hypothetical protein
VVYYPGHGDTEVPIDADIFVMVNTFGPPARTASR